MAEVFVRVKNKEQFQNALGFEEIRTMIADFGCASLDIERIKEEHPEKRFLLQLPDVLREKKAESVKKILQRAFCFDGVVLRSFDEIGLLAECAYDAPRFFADAKGDADSFRTGRDWQIVGDSFLYAYNSQAVSFYKELFPEMKWILSDELTDREMAELIKGAERVSVSPDDFIYKVYGYQPLMITNQCLNRNFAGCEKPLMRFSDQKRNSFYISSECGQCYDIVYNGQPTVVLDKGRFTKEGFLTGENCFANVLLDFTMETADELRSLLEGFFGRNGEDSCIPERLTRGHHYKGVD